jgi:glycosyltransferase domain-containing protein
MQSTFRNETAALNHRLTLVLLAEDQADFLRRALKHYSGYACSIVVLDTSSTPSASGDLGAGVDYLHDASLAGKGLSGRLAVALARVTTPYVVYAAADSFLLTDGLDDALQFLEANPQYAACQGYSLSYQAHVDHVDYFRRDRKVVEDHASPVLEERLNGFMAQSLSLFNALMRTELAQQWFAAVPADTEAHWQEIGLMSFVAASAPLRILPRPYALHFAADAQQQIRYSNALFGALNHLDPKATAAREAFAAVVTCATGASRERVLDGFKTMGECLTRRSFQADEKLLSSAWGVAKERAEPRFEPVQFVELPFYNQPFFDALASIEFLIYLLPAGAVQLKELEGALLKQHELARIQSNPDAESLLDRLWGAYVIYAFNQSVVRRLKQELISKAGEEDDIARMVAWEQRLAALSADDTSELLHDMESGRLLRWIDSRNPQAAELRQLTAKVASNPKGSQITLLLLDLEGDVFKLQTTFDSLINSHYRAFRAIVLTTGDVPAATTLQHTVHFVKVSESNYVDKLNQMVRQSASDWVMLVQAGEEFTASGLLRASVELIDAQQCRAVAVDEIHRQPDGTLAHAMRPGFNLDLLQSVPALMASHWLVRRQLLVDAGGYSRELPKALEFDLLLRLIEQGGMSGLAHLSEPVVICQAPELQANEDESQALTRHLRKRGYQAEVSSVLPGTYKIDYRHAHRPMVSILIESLDNLPQLQRCLLSIQQRTRYPRYEVLIGDNASQSPEVSAWLDQQQQTSSRVQVFRSEQRTSAAALRNQLSQQAKGEYLILLDAESEIVNVGWIESLLNQMQRPEVGVAGVRLIDRQGTITQAGLILGLGAGVGSAFVGEPKTSRGYMQRLVVEQNYSAVSSACLMISKELYDSLGGLDEAAFADALGDIDLCLKAGQAGYLTVWTPHVQIIHPGVVPSDATALSALKEKWPAQFAEDQAYNSHLELAGPGFTLRTQ